MITTQELKAVPLFSTLGDKELEYLKRTVADIEVAPGEYAVHEGESRALIITIEGKLEVIKLIDGVERVIGIRNSGDMFGEVPMVFNTPFVAGLRALEPSRVTRLEVNAYHTLAAAAPEISAKVGTSALDRVQGLQEIAASPTPPELLIIGPRWDPPTHAIRDFLQRNQVSYEWLTPDDPIVDDLKLDCLPSPQYPVVRFQDGTVAVNPTPRDIGTTLGLAIHPSKSAYDVVIVGGGPGGLAAAVYGASEGLNTVLIERESPGGQAGTSSRIENYLGFPVGVSGDELAARALRQARRLGAEIVVTRCVKSIDANRMTVTLDGDEVLQTRAIILALGVTWRRLEIESLERLVGRGVYYGASRSEAPLIQGQDVYLVGAGNSAGQAALFFATHARQVTILCRSDSLANSMSYYLIEQLKAKANVRVELRSGVVAGYGDEHLEAIDVKNDETGLITRRETSALFVFIGAETDTAWLPPEIARDKRGFVITGTGAAQTDNWKSATRDPYLLETSVPGIFAIGDVRSGSVKRVAAGVGEGSMSIAFLHQYLQLAPQPDAGAPTKS